jgi:DNA-binding MarR family transcriptional regulator
MTEVSQISDEHWDVWRSFTAMRRQLDHALGAQLQQEAPGRQLRGRELADQLGWEKSRVSHQVTRMERRGLLTRSGCDSDGRGVWIGLTPDGSRAVLGSIREHATTIRKFFFDVLSDDELTALESASHRVLDAIDPPVCRLNRPAAS